MSQIKPREKEIILKAVPGLKFDQVRFSVKPGTLVKFTLINNDDMDHNLVITQPGKRQEVVDAALALQDKGPQLNFIPKSTAVLWSIPVISPGEKQTITFTAPQKTGSYPYVCTYPGHGFIMFGVMHVTDGKMPPLADDPNVPVIHKENGDEHVEHTAIQYLDKKPTPYLYRTFIADIGPSAIAVRLTKNLSYAWDATECRFRYAWKGGYLNMEKLWAGHKQASAEVLGNVIFMDQSEYPLRIGKAGNIPDVKFKGYKLISRYPEFHYTINGVDVYELIKEKPDGTGLIRRFTIPNANQNIWFASSPQAHVTYASSTGTWSKGVLTLTPNEAKNFIITVTKNKGKMP